MIRRAFTMRLKPGGLAEYKQRHDKIWPELVAEIEAPGHRQHDHLRDRPGPVPATPRSRDEDAWDRLWHTAIHDRWGETDEPADGSSATTASSTPRRSARGVPPRDRRRGRRPSRWLTRRDASRSSRAAAGAWVAGVALGWPGAARRSSRSPATPTQLRRDGAARGGLAGCRHRHRRATSRTSAAVARLGEQVREPLRAAHHPGQCGRRVRAHRAHRGRATRPTGCGPSMIDAIAPFLTVRAFLAGHARGRLGAHRQRHLGRIAPSARAAQQRLRHGQGRAQPAHPPPRGGDRGQRRDRQRHPSRATSGPTCGRTSGTRWTPWARRRTATGRGSDWVDETGGDPPEQGRGPGAAS